MMSCEFKRLIALLFAFAPAVNLDAPRDDGIAASPAALHSDELVKLRGDVAPDATADGAGDRRGMQKRIVLLDPTVNVHAAWEAVAAREGRTVEDWLMHLAAEACNRKLPARLVGLPSEPAKG